MSGFFSPISSSLLLPFPLNFQPQTYHFYHSKIVLYCNHKDLYCRPFSFLER
ncbi:hypothetical protein ERO13_D13G074550v2 [Gossypium hirsutum]|nr:hypothetical protein ERO13_D13G074550v2 [Gossypium hirsutum]